MPLTFEEVLKSVFKKTIEDVLNEREQRIKTDDNKQDALESGVNIKTVNHESILGAGNVDIAGAVNVYTIQEGDVVPVSEIGSHDYVVQLSPNMLSAITEFKTRIDFPNMKQYDLPDITASYVAATPIAQFDDFAGDQGAGVAYGYLSFASLCFLGLFFLHYTLKDNVPVDEWHLTYLTPHYMEPEDFRVALDSALTFYTNNKGKLDYIMFDGLFYDIGGDYVTNVVVPTEDWVADNTYTDFPYKATISVPQAQGYSNVVFEVIFDVPEAISGNYAPVCYYDEIHETLSIWAKEIPAQAITIPLIKQIL